MSHFLIICSGHHIRYQAGVHADRLDGGLYYIVSIEKLYFLDSNLFYVQVSCVQLFPSRLFVLVYGRIRLGQHTPSDRGGKQ